MLLVSPCWSINLAKKIVNLDGVQYICLFRRLVNLSKTWSVSILFMRLTAPQVKEKGDFNEGECISLSCHKNVVKLTHYICAHISVVLV